MEKVYVTVLQYTHPDNEPYIGQLIRVSSTLADAEKYSASLRYEPDTDSVNNYECIVDGKYSVEPVYLPSPEDELVI